MDTPPSPPGLGRGALATRKTEWLSFPCTLGVSVCQGWDKGTLTVTVLASSSVK